MLEETAKIIATAGFFSLPVELMDDGWKRLVVASKKRAQGGLTGNSYWVCELEKKGDWVIGLWGGRLYLGSTTDALPKLMVELLKFETEKIITMIPSHFIDLYALSEISSERLHELLSSP